jgi:hypothetical protein
MTTSSATWFYKVPEKNNYLIAERVRTNFWDARYGGLWLDTIRAESPILMSGNYQGSSVELEWEPGKWCALRTNPGSEPLVMGVTNVLGLKPVFRYDDPRGYSVTEWHVGDLETRWKAIQGRPEYGQLKRLK